MPFLTEPVMKPHKGDKWKMMNELDYVTEDGRFIRVPKYFVHDLASIPRPLNLIFRKHGKQTSAAILHDWCYYKKGYLAPDYQVDRAGADKLFLEAMQACGVGYIKRNMMYYAVRIGGFMAWAS